LPENDHTISETSMTLLRPFAVVALIVSRAEFTCADWPEFRGPTGQGHAQAEGLPASWSETENVTWKVPVAGLAWSSPAIVAGRIYLTTALPGGDGPQQSLRVLCLDSASGAPVWNRELFEQRGEVEIHKKNSHASPTPIVEDDRLYVHFGPNGTACLTCDGDVVWTTQELTYGPRHGTGASPALAGDLLIIPCDGWDVQYVVGLEKATGHIRWKTPRETRPTKGFSFATPLVIETQGSRQVVCPCSDAVFAYDPATGREVWRVRYGDGYSVIPRPLFAHGLVYVCTGYNTPELLAIDPTGQGDVTDSHVQWRTNSAAPHSASPLVVGDELYMVADRGVAVCLDARTGRQHWQQRVGSAFSASPVFADGKIYFQDEHGQATVIRPGTRYDELARNTFADGLRTYASYAVAEGALFVRSETHLYRIEATGP
jgi:outer membrane protein assembly factor BamB